jgi:hypothetical protein
MPNSPLRIGPMSADEYGATAGGLRVDARSLIEAGEAAYPPELRAAMQRSKDEVGSAALDLEALSAEYGTTVVGASVHGFPGEDQVIVYLYRAPSGRTGRWYQALSESPQEAAVQQAHADAEAEAEPDEQPDEQPEAPQPESPPEPEPEPEAPEPEAAQVVDDSPPWEGYDTETVAEIQVKLGAMAADELPPVRTYEAAHKNRKGVLDEIDRLTG